MATDTVRRYSLRERGHDYVLEVTGSVRLNATLWRDGERIAQRSSMEERFTVGTTGGGTRVDVRATQLGRIRRATLRVGSREVDLDPEPGSPAARRLDKERAHPWRYAAIDVLVAIAGVVVPLLGLGALVRYLVAPILDWISEHTPALPSIPWPNVDLPDIPWPDIDLPSIDLSWLPDLDPPPWLVWLLDRMEYVWPVVLAAMFAVHEVRRRRRQDELKAEAATSERRALLTRLATDLRAVEERRRDDQAAEGADASHGRSGTHLKGDVRAPEDRVSVSGG